MINSNNIILITLGICSVELTFRPKHKLSFELDSLYREGLKKFDKVFLIEPDKVRYYLETSSKQAKILYKNNDISSLSSLIVRGMKGYENLISLLANSLFQNNCNILDPISRFNGLPAGKLFLTLQNFEKSIGTDSFISFNQADSYKFIQHFEKNNLFPAIMKPVYGKHGKYVTLLTNKKQSDTILKNYYKTVEEGYKELSFPILKIID